MINWHACVGCYNYNNVMCTKSKHLHNISYGIKFMKLQFKEFHTRHEGEMEEQPPSHVVTGRTLGHSLHQMQRSSACVSR